MTLNKDRMIVAQNAATAASNIIAAEASFGALPIPELLERFETIRTLIFEGSWDLGQEPQAPNVTVLPPIVQNGVYVDTGSFPPQVQQTEPIRPPLPPTYRPPATPSPPPRPDDRARACPKCGGETWDNRAGKNNPKAPDFRCKDKDHCDGVIWPARY